MVSRKGPGWQQVGVLGALQAFPRVIFITVQVTQAGTWDPLLQCCNAYTWTNIKLYGTKNNCKNVQLGQNYGQKIQRDRKTQLPLLKSQEQKQGVGTKSRVLSMPPVHNTTRGVDNPPKPLLWPDPWTRPYPQPR